MGFDIPLVTQNNSAYAFDCFEPKKSVGNKKEEEHERRGSCVEVNMFITSGWILICSCKMERKLASYISAS